MNNLRIVIGSDHGGFDYKKQIIEFLKDKNIDYTDIGTNSEVSCDYPVIAQNACKLITEKKADKGILICGTGIGMSIAANKVKGIRAALCSDTFSAKMSRQHNDANVLCLGQRVMGICVVKDIIDVWLNTDFEGGRHLNRIEMLEN